MLPFTQLAHNISEVSPKFTTILSTANITATGKCAFLKAMLLFDSPQVSVSSATCLPQA